MANRLKLSSQFSSEEMKRFIVELQGQYNSLVDEINLKDKMIKDLQTKLNGIVIPNQNFLPIDFGAADNDLMKIDLKGNVLRSAGKNIDSIDALTWDGYSLDLTNAGNNEIIVFDVTNLSIKTSDRKIGNSDTNVPVNNGTVNTNLNADMLDGKHLGQDSGQINENGANLSASAYVETDANKKFVAIAKDTQHAVSFQNSWVNYDTTNAQCQYIKIGDRVYICGFMKNGTIGATAFTLPTGYRPSKVHNFPQESAGGNCRVQINPDGTVQPQSGTNTWVTLAGINFDINT